MYSKTLKDIVGVIWEYLCRPLKQVLLEKKTGLCGSWDDEKTAEEIIRDIKTHRRGTTNGKIELPDKPP